MTSAARLRMKPIGERKNSRPPKAIFTSPGVSRIQLAPKASAARGRRRGGPSGSTRASRGPPQLVAGSAASSAARPSSAPRRSRAAASQSPIAAAASDGSWAASASAPVEVVPPQPVLHARQDGVGRHARLRGQRPAGDLRLEEGARAGERRPSPALAMMLARIAACAASGKLSRSGAASARRSPPPRSGPRAR